MLAYIRTFLSDVEITLLSAILAGIGGALAGVATLALALLTARYVRLTNRLVEETRAARAPGVVVDIEFDAFMPRLVIANRGSTAAHGIRIKVSERNIVWRQRSDAPGFAYLSPIKAGVSFLPPGRTLRYLLFALDLQGTLASKECGVVEFDVTYQDDSGESFHRQFSIDFGAFGDMTVEGRSPHEVVADAIRRAAEHLRPRRLFAVRTRSCPVCFEKIRAEARKCPHCLETVEPLPPEKPSENGG